MNGYHQKVISSKSNQNLLWRTIRNNIKSWFTINIESFCLLKTEQKKKAFQRQSKMTNKASYESSQQKTSHAMSEQISSLFIKYESSLRLVTDSSRKCCMKREEALITNQSNTVKDHLNVSIQWHKMTQSSTQTFSFA